MRDPKEIVTKIKQIQFEHLKKVYESNLSKEPQNCIYNKKVIIHGDEDVLTRVCSYYSKGETVEICNNTQCSARCNAFVPKFTKPELRKMLDSDIVENPKNYPEITVLNWTLENPPMVSTGEITWLEKLKFKVQTAWAKFKSVFR